MIENDRVNTPVINGDGRDQCCGATKSISKTRHRPEASDDNGAAKEESQQDENHEDASTTKGVASSAVAASATKTMPKQNKQQKEGLPGMYWLNMPEHWSVKTDEQGDKHLKVTCPEEVDFWRHTLHGFVKDDAPFYWRFVYGDFEARLTMKGKFHYLYDMAGLMVRQNEDQWMTCGVTNFQDNLQSRYHKHGSKHLYVSTTFTRQKSDWSTHRAMQKKQHKSSVFHVWVRRIGNLIECYYSLDNDLWIKVREGAFAPGIRKLRVGMVCTAPESAGFSVIFSDFMIRGGDKMPADNIENMVYKTSGTQFLGMLERKEVERRTQQAKERMYKRLEKENREEAMNIKPASQLTVPRTQPAATRTFQARDTPEEHTPPVHHRRGEDGNPEPLTTRIIQLPVRSSQKQATYNSAVKPAMPAREWKPRPTNPYAVPQPPPPPKPSPPVIDDRMTGVPAEEPTPALADPPRKAPMTNPYAVAPPRPPPPSTRPPHTLEKKMEMSSARVKQAKPPQRHKSNTRTPQRLHSKTKPQHHLDSKARGPRNEFSGAPLKIAQVDDTPQRRGFPPLRRKSDMGPLRGRKPLNQRGSPPRRASDMGPRGRRPHPRPPRDLNDAPARRKKSWWNLSIKLPKRKSKTEERQASAEEKKVFPGKGHRLGKGSRWMQSKSNDVSRSGPSKPQRKPSSDDETSLSQSRKTTTSKRGRAQHHDDAPPTRPRRMPSVDDDDGLVSSDDDELVIYSVENPDVSPPTKPRRVPSFEDDTILLPTDDEDEGLMKKPENEGSSKAMKEKPKKTKSKKEKKKKKKDGSKSGGETTDDDGSATANKSDTNTKQKVKKKKTNEREDPPVETQ
jgi:regulation of enolase protein 1 (concanavalin A-like superfamily)